VTIRALAITILAISFPGNAAEGPVWFWFSTCGGPMMTLELQLDKATIYKGSFPLCRAERESIASDGERSNIEIAFRPSRAIVWTGYQDEPQTTKANQRLECDLWQAGADPNAMLIGVGVMSKNQIYMNTIHVASPSERRRSEIASGLVILTYPTESKNDGSAKRQ
jgi:hypothetical protein